MNPRTFFALVLTLALGVFADITGSIEFLNVQGAKPVATVAYLGQSYAVRANGAFTVPASPTSVKVRHASTARILNREFDAFGRKINANQVQGWGSRLSSLKQYRTENVQVAGVASRALDTPPDTLYIVVNGDTLWEVPVTSWNQVLPPNYVQQRNVQVNVNQKFYKNTAQVVWWNSDSIANVSTLQRNSTDSGSFSGYIYTVYNDSDYARNAVLYSLFVRTTSGDSITSYTGVLDVVARAGNLVFSPSSFKVNTWHTTLGYSLTPNDSSVAVFSRKSIEMVYTTTMIDSVYTVKAEGDTIFNKFVPSSWDSADTSISIGVVSARVTGTFAEDASKASLAYTSGNRFAYIMDPRIVTAGQAIDYDAKSYYTTPKLWVTDGKVNDYTLTIRAKIIKKYWKNP